MAVFSSMQFLEKTLKPRETSENVANNTKDGNIYMNVSPDFNIDILVEPDDVSHIPIRQKHASQKYN